METLRKALVRLLNNRLATLMVQHNILKGNQFAGVPGSSTFEPIRIINEIIEDAREKDKEIWILFQDLSKAYDRVNIHMLDKALKRLKIPQSFCNIIRNLFTNRKNRIFTAVGLTDEYDVLIGIDQGEVISPLLWCIYYDPLLCEVESRKFGYRLNHQYRQNLYSDQQTELEQQIVDSAFMDDTTWIAENQNNMESILSIADDFYLLNNIKVNKEKSKLLAKRSGKEKTIQKLQLSFGRETIDITPATYRESVRILGVWINLAGHRKYVLQQARMEVLSMCNIIKRKPITDKQLLYLYNMVIIPRIEYRTQLTILSKRDCDSIIAPFRQLYKNKIRLSSTAPNAILENNFIYKF